jgi:hypothetical protein
LRKAMFDTPVARPLGAQIHLRDSRTKM